MELMCNLMLDKERVESRFGVDFDDHFASALSTLTGFEQEGLLSLSPDRINIHEEGRLIIRNICMAFDEYVSGDRSDTSSSTYSRTV